METSKKIDELLKDLLSVDRFDAQPPRVEILSRARKIIMLRNNSEHKAFDFFSLLASFLNLRIKLYHAVIAVLILFGAFLFMKRDPAPPESELSSSTVTGNLAAVQNPTVLSCIQTFISPK